MTATELTALLATPAAFRAWLEAKEPGEVVGIVRLPCECPIARFLHESGFDMARVGAIRIDFDACRIDLDEWAGTFVEKVDNTPREPNVPIAAAECLRILDEIEGGEG